ncbi:hypothetical protein BN871_EV_00020 [Paenibacillus sp. P22]|nr:hypothetical protein BN871_EV_00020 [Paenibacillus sp. P22]
MPIIRHGDRHHRSLLLNRTGEAFLEVLDGSYKSFLVVGGEVFGIADGSQNLRLVGIHEAQQLVLEAADVLNRDIIHMAARDCEQGDNLALQRHRLVDALLQDFQRALAAVEAGLGYFVQIGAELGECRQLAVLGKVKLERAGYLFHRLRLSGGAYAGYGVADVDSRTLAGVEQVGFQEDLSVRDGDDVRRDVSGDIPGLRLNERKRRKGTAAELVVQLGRALQQTGVQVEDVARIGFPARWAAKQQGQLAVSGGLLGQVIVDDENMLAVVHEVLAHGAARIRSDVKQRGRLGSARRYDDRVIQRALAAEGFDNRTNRGLLLTDSDVDANHAVALLIDDRIDRDLRFARLAVADDELALAAADRNHGVDRLDARLHRLEYGFTGHDARCRRFDRTASRRRDRTVAVKRLAQSVDNAAQKSVAYRNFHDAARTLHLVAFTDVRVRSKDNDTDIALLKVERHAYNAVGELEQLAGHSVLKAVHASDTVADLDNRSDLVDLDLGFILFNLLLNQRADFIRSDAQFLHPCLQCLGIDLLAQAVQLGGEGSVIDLVSDADLDAAQKGRLDDLLADDAPSRDDSELLEHLRELGFAERDCRINGRAGFAGSFVGNSAVGFADAADRRLAAAFDQKRDRIQNNRGHAVPDCFFDDVKLDGRLDARRRQETGYVSVGCQAPAISSSCWRTSATRFCVLATSYSACA